MTKRKRNECCIRISDCVNAKYFADFLKDIDLLNLSICNSIYYSDFNRYFANRIWWPLEHVQHVSPDTLNHIRKLSYSESLWNHEEKQLPKRVTDLRLFKPHKYQYLCSALFDKYKNDLQFLEVFGICKDVEIPNGIKVFSQKCPSNFDVLYDNYNLNLPSSLVELSICSPRRQQLTNFPPSLTKLTFGMVEGSLLIRRLPIFPTGLIHLTLMYGFDQFIAEFPPGLISLTIQNNVWNQHLVSLPTGLEYLKLYGKSTIPLKPGLLPPSLKIFIYRSKCNILYNVLPLELKYVSITIESENGFFDCNFLPSSVLQLNITTFYQFGLIYMEMIPKSVKIFKYKTCGQVLLKKLPQHLEELWLQTSQDIRGPSCRFPPNLRHLFVKADHFSPPLKQDVFPTNLQTLYYNCNDRISHNILPSGLKSLSLGKKCRQLLVYGSLPNSLESFHAPYVSRKTMKSYQKTGVIPKSCLIK